MPTLRNNYHEPQLLFGVDVSLTPPPSATNRTCCCEYYYSPSRTYIWPAAAALPVDHPNKMSLILTIFALVFFTQLISWIGQSVLLELVRIQVPLCILMSNGLTLLGRTPQAYVLYLRIFHSSMAAKQRELKTEILNRKTELMKTSAQDQFAKWAKLRRSVDKGLADLEKLSTLFFPRVCCTGPQDGITPALNF